jgi:hypothetical protein
MAGFDSGSAVEPMDWDFTKHGGGTGTVPEPSNNQMKRFQDEFARIMRDGEALIKTADDAASMTEEDFATYQKSQQSISDRLDAAIAKLCQNHPSAEQVEKLPFRVKTAFSTWLMKQFNPEKEQAATNK